MTQAKPNPWTQLQSQERLALLARRRLVAPTLSAEQADPEADRGAIPRVGLALSGGGVRSATFALGLLRGLAQSGRPPLGHSHADTPSESLSRAGLLGRMDYISSVSGGGYAAAMLGRLIHKGDEKSQAQAGGQSVAAAKAASTSAATPEPSTELPGDCGLLRAQKALSHHDSPVLDWLRRNGRYLSPGGSRDMGMVAVTYLRALLAIHMEFMVLCMALGLVVIAPHLWQHSTQTLSSAWQGWLSPWMALSGALALALAPGLVAAYWYTRDTPNPKLRPQATQVLQWLISLALLVTVARAGDQQQMSVQLVREGPGANLLLTITLASVWLGQTLTGAALLTPLLRRDGPALATARLRNWLTRALHRTGQCCLLLIALGALDSASWWLLRELLVGNSAWWGGIGAGGVGVLLLRSFAQPLQQLAADTEGKAKDWLPRLLNVVSAFGLLTLVMAWLVVLQWFVFAPDALDALNNAPPWFRAVLILMAWASWVLLTSAHAHMPNSTSLHAFYRARLTRAYLAVGNLDRLPWSGEGKERDVRTVVAGDDGLLAHYSPETHGGPIHLINTCLNETRDSDSNLYNADRKGCLLTVTSRGLEVGPREVHKHLDDQSTGTVGQWVAISGAAASPGAGSYTSRGLALLLYFLGIRLGFWIPSPIDTPRLKWLSHLGWARLPKPAMLACEASATFFGKERPWWYLSDGGHFDNTGVYALIKRELDFIILSDASSDPLFQFGDLENMVRKARIDFGADIDFYTAEEAASLFTMAGPDMTVLSPEAMRDSCSSRGVLLARIRYSEREDPKRKGQTWRPEGTLLVIKPNLHNALNVDVLSYAERNPTFPHESTADQFFDEAQWESYHRLGEDMGQSMSETWLAQLPGWRTPARHGVKVSARLRPAVANQGNAAPANPLWKRSARNAAINTTLGLGASGTLLLSGWQIVDDMNARQKDARSQARELHAKVSQELSGFDRQCKPISDATATQAESLLLDVVRSPLLTPLDKGSVERMSARIRESCHESHPAWRTCTEQAALERQSLCLALRRPPASATALSYWSAPQTPQEQDRAARLLLSQWAPVLFEPPPAESALPTQVATATPSSAGLGETLRQTTGSAEPAEGRKAGSDWPEKLLEAEPTATGRTVSPVVTAAPTPTPTPEPVPGQSPRTTGSVNNTVDTPGDTPGSAKVWATCQPSDQRDDKPVLYVQIYDEQTRTAAEDIRRQLKATGPGAWILPPTDNVVRRAMVQERRSPVPWPHPTLLVHDAAGLPCAKALKDWLTTPAAGPAPTDRPTWGEVWVRRVPAGLPVRPGVYELWLPTAKDKMVAKAS